MRTLTPRIIAATFAMLIAACSAPRPLPKYQTPIARTRIQTVRTTAYTDTEADHIRYTNHNALGGWLQCGQVNSAAADWSRWPAGTVFRIRETGELFRVDDYGWALAGTNTIDLYKPSRAAMKAWGVRHVTIENLQWGDPHQSLAILHQRSGYRHIRRMIDEMEGRMAELEKPVETPAPVAMSAPQVPVPIASAEHTSPGESEPALSGRAGIAVSSARSARVLNPFFGGNTGR